MDAQDTHQDLRLIEYEKLQSVSPLVRFVVRLHECAWTRTNCKNDIGTSYQTNIINVMLPLKK